MTSTNGAPGRLCNHVFRNIAVSIIAEKNDLVVSYGYNDIISQLGIHLFSGSQNHENATTLTDHNYFDILNHSNLNANLNIDWYSYFQSKEITNLTYNWVRSDKNKSQVISKNSFKNRYETNNDCFIHIRLSDAASFNPGIKYYLKALSYISFENLYIGTDSPDHSIISELKTLYPECTILNYDEIHTIHFGSTCKHVILSHGSFSAFIGYISFFSNIYYPDYEICERWHGDMFSVPGFQMISL